MSCDEFEAVDRGEMEGVMFCVWAHEVGEESLFGGGGDYDLLESCITVFIIVLRLNVKEGYCSYVSCDSRYRAGSMVSSQALYALSRHIHKIIWTGAQRNGHVDWRLSSKDQDNKSPVVTLPQH